MTDAFVWQGFNAELNFKTAWHCFTHLGSDCRSAKRSCSSASNSRRFTSNLKKDKTSFHFSILPALMFYVIIPWFDDVSVSRSQKNDSFDQPEWLVPETANVHSCHLRSAEYLEKSIFVNKRKVLSALRSLISSFEGDNTLPKLHIRAPYTLISAWRYCWRRILIYFSKADLVVHHVRLV